MLELKEILNITSGLLAMGTATLFSYKVFKQKIPQNLATWAMILILDITGLALAIASGNKEPWMQAGWTFAAVTIVTAILFSNKTFSWGNVEWVSLFFCGVAILTWVNLGAERGFWAYAAAVYISVIPLVLDNWKEPQRTTTWVWAWSVVVCILQLLSIKEGQYNMGHVFVPTALLVLNIGMTWLTWREKPQ